MTHDELEEIKAEIRRSAWTGPQVIACFILCASLNACLDSCTRGAVLELTANRQATKGPTP